MENAVDALKIAFAVIVFTIALTLAISTFSQARETSEAVLYMNDKTNYYSWEDEVNFIESERIVGIDAIIPTLYRYYKENYTVIFEGIDNEYSVYEATTKTEDGITKIDKWKTRSGTGENVFYFDLNSEITANCPWVGTVNDIKKNLDLFLDGTSKYSSLEIDKISFGNTARYVNYNNGFIKEYANATFLEQLGEYSTDRTYGMNNGVLEVQDEEGKKAKFTQNISENKWNCIEVDSGFSIELGVGIPPKTFTATHNYSLEEIATVIDDDASTFLDSESGEIIELAKPTIKRVIKYTLIENNP